MFNEFVLYRNKLLSIGQVALLTTDSEVIINRGSVIDISEIKDITAYIKDKRLFLLNQWLIDHPYSKINNYADLHKIINKSKVAQAWLQTANGKYVELSSMPEWIIEVPEIRNSWNVTYLDDYAEFKIAQRKHVEEKKRLSDEYRRNIDKINDLLNNQMTSIGTRNPLVLIEKITVDALPMEKYEPTLQMDEEEAKIKLKEILVNYKQELANKLVNKELTIPQLLDLLKNL
jgi:hypothetical protein